MANPATYPNETVPGVQTFSPAVQDGNRVFVQTECNIPDESQAAHLAMQHIKHAREAFDLTLRKLGYELIEDADVSPVPEL